MNKLFKSLLTMLLIALLIMSVTYWLMQWLQPAPRAVLPATTSAPPVRIQEAALLFNPTTIATTPSPSFFAWQLRGVIVAKNKVDSLAIFSRPGVRSRVTAIGQQIEDGPSLEEVHPTYVTLRHQGTMQRIELPKKAELTVATPNNRSSKRP